jgi:hypothetical protein
MLFPSGKGSGERGVAIAGRRKIPREFPNSFHLFARDIDRKQNAASGLHADSLIVIEDVCKKYSCGCTVKTAGKPAQPIEKSTAGASQLTQVIVAKFADHLPLHRQAKIFRRFGVELSDRTMCGWMRQCADLLDPQRRPVLQRIGDRLASFTFLD